MYINTKNNFLSPICYISNIYISILLIVYLSNCVQGATVPFLWEMLCHTTLNKIWQLLYYIILWKITIWQYTIPKCSVRLGFRACGIAYDSNKYYPVNWPIRRQKRQGICNNCAYVPGKHLNYNSKSTSSFTFHVLLISLVCFNWNLSIRM